MLEARRISTKKGIDSVFNVPFIGAFMGVSLIVLIRHHDSLRSFLSSDLLITVVAILAGVYAWMVQNIRLKVELEGRASFEKGISENLTTISESSGEAVLEAKAANDTAGKANRIAKAAKNEVATIAACTTFSREVSEHQARVEVFSTIWEFNGFYSDYRTDNITDCKQYIVDDPEFMLIPIHYSTYHKYLTAVALYPAFFDFPEGVDKGETISIIGKIHYALQPFLYVSSQGKCTHYHLLRKFDKYYRTINHLLTINARRILFQHGYIFETISFNEELKRRLNELNEERTRDGQTFIY